MRSPIAIAELPDAPPPIAAAASPFSPSALAQVLSLLAESDEGSMMGNEAVEQRLLSLAREISGLEIIELDVNLLSAGMHSLALLELLYAVEEEYGVPVLDEVSADIASIHWLAQWIAAHPVRQADGGFEPTSQPPY